MIKFRYLPEMTAKVLCDAVNSSNTLEDSRLKIDIAVLRDYLRQDELRSMSWVPSAEQLADSLTKVLTKC